MNETIFIVYSVDDDHTVNSRQVIAVCDGHIKAIDACIEYAIKDMTNEDKWLNPSDIGRLQTDNKTALYDGEGQLLILEHPVNTLIV